VLEGIRRVVSEKRRLGSSTPLVNLRFIVMKHSEHQVPQLREFATQLGVDVLTLRKFHFVPGTEPADALGSLGGSLLPSESKYQLPAIPPGELHPVRISRNPCRNLWNCPTIHWDGTICSCFMDYNERRPLGSLQRSSFREIWYGTEYRELRAGFRRAWQQLPLCGQCACGFEGGDVGREANAEAFSISEAR
jgi:MoaA/NifB/PqqE/SkfB family radical SAM enzyme